MPKISIITPCYNSARFVGKTIESVRAQTLTDWEHIVVDDGSTDESAEVVARIAVDEPRLRLLSQENGGVSRARNAGFAASQSESQYLLFLDADDCLVPEMLANMSTYMDAHPDVGLAYCDVACVDANDRPLTPMNTGHRPVPRGLGVGLLTKDECETPLASIFCLTWIVPSISLFRRSTFNLAGAWCEEQGHIYEDTDQVIRTALHSAVHYIPQELVQYRRHSSQSTANAEIVHRQEQKLYARWHSKTGLTECQKRRVDEALWFRDTRMAIKIGMHASARHLRQGEVVQAARFFGGALRRYPKSLFPPLATMRQEQGK